MIKLATGFAFLAFSVAYLWYGLRYSFYTTNGRLGAGSFPRIVGSLLVVASVWNVVKDLRHRSPADPNAYWRDIGILGLMIVGFIVTMDLFGAVVGMFAFVLAVLSFLNSGRWVQNLSVAFGLSLFIHLLFDVWLSAPLPIGRFEIPLLS